MSTLEGQLAGAQRGEEIPAFLCGQWVTKLNGSSAGIGVEDMADGARDEAHHTTRLMEGVAQVPHHTLHDGTGSLAPLLPRLTRLPRHQAAWDELEQNL